MIKKKISTVVETGCFPSPSARGKACLARTAGDVCRTESYRGAVIAAKAAIANKTKTQGRIGDCGFRRNDVRCCESWRNAAVLICGICVSTPFICVKRFSIHNS
jgi:hypothetical protein